MGGWMDMTFFRLIYCEDCIVFGRLWWHPIEALRIRRPSRCPCAVISLKFFTIIKSNHFIYFCRNVGHVTVIDHWNYSKFYVQADGIILWRLRPLCACFARHRSRKIENAGRQQAHHLSAGFRRRNRFIVTERKVVKVDLLLSQQSMER